MPSSLPYHRARVLLALLAGLQIASATQVHANSCAGPLPYPEALARADAVFVGEVQSIRNRASFLRRAQTKIWNVWLIVTGNGNAAPDRSTEGRIVRLRVQELFKGPEDQMIDILISEYEDWEIPFRGGETYLVFAYRFSGLPAEESKLLGANICGRTTRLPEETGALAQIRALSAQNTK